MRQHLAIDMRTAGIDDMAAMRALHAASFRTYAAHHYSDDEIASFLTAIETVAYVEQLARSVAVVASFEGELVGSAGWMADTVTPACRISHIFVRPFFARLGIGTALLKQCEQQAAAAGLTRLTLRASLNATEFFETCGYEITSHGVGRVVGRCDMNIAFMRKEPELPAGFVAGSSRKGAAARRRTLLSSRSSSGPEATPSRPQRGK